MHSRRSPPPPPLLRVQSAPASTLLAASAAAAATPPAAAVYSAAGACLSPQAETETYGGWCVLRHEGRPLYLHAASGRTQLQRPAVVPASAPPLADCSDSQVSALVASCAARRALGLHGSRRHASLFFTSSPPPLDDGSAASPPSSAHSPLLEPGPRPLASPDWRADREYVARETWRILARWKGLQQLDDTLRRSASPSTGLGHSDGTEEEAPRTPTAPPLPSGGLSAAASGSTRHALEDGLDQALSGRSAAERAQAWLRSRAERIRSLQASTEQARREAREKREVEVRSRAEAAAKKRAKVLTRIAAAKKVQAVWRKRARERRDARLRDDPVAHTLAVRLQAALRGYKARQELHRLKALRLQ
jgi:hypothetical protein